MLITGVLHNSLFNSYKYGISKHGTILYLFKPFKKEYPNLIVGCSKKPTYSNLLVVIDFISGSEKANIVHILGECGDWPSEESAILWNYCPYYYKKLKETPVLELNTRAKVLDWDTFNIDPQGCQDIDDCISWSFENGILRVGITIADVAHLFNSFPHLVNEAYTRGQTFYSDTEIRRMIPREYEEMCSLLPDKSRNGITLFFDVKNNNISNLRFEETIIVNKRSYTYENISLDTRLQDFLIHYSRSDDSHKWIESLMLLYNKTVADLLYENKAGIFRKQKLKENIESIYHKYCPFLLYESAEYCNVLSEDLRHHALELDRYCHITSPIRRFSDTFNQQKLKEILKTGSPLSRSENNNIEINEKCFKEIIGEKDETKFLLALNQRQKEARKHDRDLFFLKKLKENTEKEIKGVIVDFDEKWFKVFIFEWNRIIKISRIDGSEKYELEQIIKLKYFCKLNEVNWKDKLIFSPISMI